MKRHAIPAVLSVACLLALALPGCSGQPQPGPDVAEETASSSSEAAVETRSRPQPKERRPAESVPEDRPQAPRKPVPPATITLTIPEGTRVTLAMADALSSKTAQVGDPVAAVLRNPIVVGDRVAFPAGSRLEGSVTGVKPAKKGFKDTGGGLSVAFDRIVAPGGRRASIIAGFTKLAEGSGKKKGAIIGGSAAGGALLGKILGKDSKGAAIIGGAIGTAVAGATRGKEARIAVEEKVTVALEQSVRVTVPR